MKLVCDKKYVILPVNRNLKKKRLEFFCEGELVYDLEIELDNINPDQYFYLNMERFTGMVLEIKCEPEMCVEIRKVDSKEGNTGLYQEKYRPGFHFSAAAGWLNDPNGLVCYNGQYLMFYQHNPVGCQWGNMHWGYAVSKDLLHWEEKEPALYPDELGTMFSGSAIVDKRNVTGLKENENDVILLFYTAAGDTSVMSKAKPFVQCMAYSTDGGKSFRKYGKNPLVPELAKGNRDPKVIYHQQSDSYVMALYLIDNKFALLTSKNMLEWTKIQEIALENDAECPDFYPLAVDGKEGNIKWVLSGASDRYLVGSFDGKQFVLETESRRLHYGNSSYAAQTWSDTGDGRRLRIAWNTFEIPSMPFNKCMTLPCEMTLKTLEEGLGLCVYPVQEIEQLYGESFEENGLQVKAGEKYCRDLDGKGYDIKLRVREKADFAVSLFGLEINCVISKKELKCLEHTAPAEMNGDGLELRLLVDRTGGEIYINGGKAYMSVGYIMDYNLKRFEIGAGEKAVNVEKLEIAEIGGIW